MPHTCRRLAPLIDGELLAAHQDLQDQILSAPTEQPERRDEEPNVEPHAAYLRAGAWRLPGSTATDAVSGGDTDARGCAATATAAILALRARTAA